MLRPRQFLAVAFRPSPLLGRAPGLDLAPRPSSCPSDSVVLDPIVRLARQECGLVEAWGGEQALNLIETVQELVKDLKDGGAINLAICSPRTAQTIASAAIQPHRGGLILALGMLGVFFPLLSIFAWSMGHSDLGAMNSARMDRAGFNQTSTGRTLGMFASLGYGALIGLGVLSTLLKQ